MTSVCVCAGGGVYRSEPEKHTFTREILEIEGGEERNKQSENIDQQAIISTIDERYLNAVCAEKDVFFFC